MQPLTHLHSLCVGLCWRQVFPSGGSCLHDGWCHARGTDHSGKKGLVGMVALGTGNEPEMACVLAFLCGSCLRPPGNWTGKRPSLPQVT